MIRCLNCILYSARDAMPTIPIVLLARMWTAVMLFARWLIRPIIISQIVIIVIILLTINILIVIIVVSIITALILATTASTPMEKVQTLIQVCMTPNK